MFEFLVFQVGSPVFYVLNDGPSYRIRKTRIAEITKQPSLRLFFDKYHYRCEDGYCFESLESTVPAFVFFTRKEAVSFVIERLRSSLEYEKSYIITVHQRLEQLQASLRVYSAAAKGHEHAHTNLSYAYYIDDDDDHYVIRRITRKRLIEEHGPNVDFNALGCRDLGNGLLLSHLCRTKEEAAYRITQFLHTDIARQIIICAGAEEQLEQTKRSLKLYERYIASE